MAVTQRSRSLVVERSYRIGAQMPFAPRARIEGPLKAENQPEEYSELLATIESEIIPGWRSPTVGIR